MNKLAADNSGIQVQVILFHTYNVVLTAGEEQLYSQYLHSSMVSLFGLDDGILKYAFCAII